MWKRQVFRVSASTEKGSLPLLPASASTSLVESTLVRNRNTLYNAIIDVTPVKNSAAKAAGWDRSSGCRAGMIGPLYRRLCWCLWRILTTVQVGAPNSIEALRVDFLLLS